MGTTPSGRTSEREAEEPGEQSPPVSSRSVLGPARNLLRRVRDGVSAAAARLLGEGSVPAPGRERDGDRRRADDRTLVVDDAGSRLPSTRSRRSGLPAERTPDRPPAERTPDRPPARVTAVEGTDTDLVASVEGDELVVRDPDNGDAYLGSDVWCRVER